MINYNLFDLSTVGRVVCLSDGCRPNTVARTTSLTVLYHSDKKCQKTYYTDVITVLGWGQTVYGGQLSDILREVAVPIWYFTECKKAYSYRVFDTNICAALYGGGRDSCLVSSSVYLTTRKTYTKYAEFKQTKLHFFFACLRATPVVRCWCREETEDGPTSE